MAKRNRGCKVCSSPSVDFVDAEIGKGTPYRLIVEQLAERGEEGFSNQNISTHKKSHWQPDTPELDRAYEVLRDKIVEQMQAAPSPMLAAGYMVILHNLEGIKHSKPSPETLLRAITAVGKLGGLSTDQEMLLAYMEAAERAGQFGAKPDLRVVGSAE
jgi:hypothetical protein